jgi:hypothetical protein
MSEVAGLIFYAQIQHSMNEMCGPSDAGNATAVTSTNAWPALMAPILCSFCAPLYRDKAIKKPMPSDRMPNDAAAESNCLLGAVRNSMKNLDGSKVCEVEVLCGFG